QLRAQRCFFGGRGAGPEQLAFQAGLSDQLGHPTPRPDRLHKYPAGFAFVRRAAAAQPRAASVRPSALRPKGQWELRLRGIAVLAAVFAAFEVLLDFFGVVADGLYSLFQAFLRDTQFLR